METNVLQLTLKLTSQQIDMGICNYFPSISHFKIPILNYRSKFPGAPNDFKFGVDLVHRILRPAVKKSAHSG